MGAQNVDILMPNTAGASSAKVLLWNAVRTSKRCSSRAAIFFALTAFSRSLRIAGILNVQLWPLVLTA
jgi:hypothetical protein